MPIKKKKEKHTKEKYIQRISLSFRGQKRLRDELGRWGILEENQKCLKDQMESLILKARKIKLGIHRWISQQIRK